MGDPPWREKDTGGPWGHTQHQHGSWDWRAQAPDPRQTWCSTKPAKMGFLATAGGPGPWWRGFILGGCSAYTF